MKNAAIMEGAVSGKQRYLLYLPGKVRATHTAKFDDPCEQNQREKNIATRRHHAVDGYGDEVAHRQNDQIGRDGKPENNGVQNRFWGRTLARRVCP